MQTTPLGDGAELVPMEPWQAAELAAYTARNRDHLAPWLPWATSITDTETAHAFLQRYADATARDGGRIYALRVDGAMVGGTLFRVFEPDAGTCEIGAWLSADATGRGLVTRAAASMVAWAVDVRGLRRVEWRCVPDNAPSRAVALRLGFRLDGVLREAFDYRGRAHDLEVWSLLASDRTAATGT